MTYLDILNNKEKFLNKTIQFHSKNQLPDEIYANTGMTGKIIDIKTDDLGFEDVLIVTVDWNGFEDINKPFEEHDWYLNQKESMELNRIQGTMKEAKMYPSSGKEDIHVMSGDEIHFTFLDNFTSYEKAKSAHSESKTDTPFIEWLAEKAGF